MTNPSIPQSIDAKINRLGYRTVIVVFVSALVSFFLPLHAPGATQAEAAQWLMSDKTGYLLGWINQVIAAVAFSIALACAAWTVFATHPLKSITSLTLTFIATIVFFIVKFFNLWAVPMMANALATGAPESASAETFLLSLGPSLAFGLGPSLDYLGFALYAAAGLVIVRPLFALSLSAKIASIGLLLYGVLYFLIFPATWIDLLGQKGVEEIVMSVAILLFVAVIALFFHFRANSGQNFAQTAAQPAPAE